MATSMLLDTRDCRRWNRYVSLLLHQDIIDALLGSTLKGIGAICLVSGAGKLVDLADTIKGFKGLCNGDYDHLPEQAFYMVGSIEEAIAKAEKLAEAA